MKLFLGTDVKVKNLSVSVIGVIEGQLRVLCEIPKLQENNCLEVLFTFEAKFSHNQISPKSVSFGYEATKKVLPLEP